MVQNDSACGLYANLLSVSVVSCINQASVSVVGCQLYQPSFGFGCRIAHRNTKKSTDICRCFRKLRFRLSLCSPKYKELIFVDAFGFEGDRCRLLFVQFCAKIFDHGPGILTMTHRRTEITWAREPRLSKLRQCKICIVLLLLEPAGFVCVKRAIGASRVRKLRHDAGKDAALRKSPDDEYHATGRL